MNEKIMNDKKPQLSHALTFVACMGMFLSTLDTGIMNVALPFFTHFFNTHENIAAMSVVGYTVSLAAVIMPLGSLSDRIGKLKISFFGFLLFGISSLL
ncbi:MAG: MFS transporter, partial [Tetragenococcus halophilus]|nr:MFS transporter [Tetragenococcus halophilus]